MMPIATAVQQDCNLPQATYTATWTGDFCTGGFALSALGPATTQPVVMFNKIAGLCFGSASNETLFYTIGASVPFSMLEGAKLVVE